MKEVLIELVKRISRKAIILVISMILIYMIYVTPNATNPILSISVISSLSLIGVGLQFYLDLKDKNKRT